MAGPNNKQQAVDPKVGQVAEGQMFPFDGVEKINTGFLKTVEFNSPNQLIEIKNPEFSAVCPFSGLPDIAKVEIAYKPASGLIIELKALKYYLTSFRNVGIYQEAVTQRIHEDLCKVLNLQEHQIEVVTIYNVRGGMYVTCTCGSVEDIFTETEEVDPDEPDFDSGKEVSYSDKTE